MIDRLRVAWHQPLSTHARRRLFAAAVLVIVAAGAGFAFIDRPAVAPDRRSTSALVDSEWGSEPPSGPTEVVPLRPSEEGHSRAAVDSYDDARAPRAAALRFLRGYLPYTHGRRNAAAIPAASAALQRHLAGEQPRVPLRERHRRPRVVLIHGDGVGERLAGMRALVEDGARRYTVSLELHLTRAGWQVVAVGS